MNKKKFKFNIIDLMTIIFVLIAASLLVASFISEGVGAKNREEVMMQYVIQTDMISEDLADNVSPGDAVFDKMSGKKIGVVASSDVRSATHTAISSEGVQKVSEIEGYRVLYITVEADALSGPNGYTVENVPISAGADYELMFKNLYCTGDCISVEVIG